MSFDLLRSQHNILTGWAVKFLLPANGNFPAKTFYFGTSDMEVDGDLYESALTNVPDLTFQLGAGADGGRFLHETKDGYLYSIFQQYAEVIEDVEIIIKECLAETPNVWFAETVFIGFADDLILNDADGTLEFACVSDMSRQGFYIGGRILTNRRCGTKFNVEGILSPSVDLCGWQVAQGGDPLFCDKTLDGAKGCKSHLNEHRFVAIQQLSAIGIQITAEGGLGGTGFGYGNGPCFTGEMIVKTSAGYKPISQIEKGEIITAFYSGNKPKLVDCEITALKHHKVFSYLEINFGNGLFLCVTPEHPIYTGNGYFTPAGEFTVYRLAQGYHFGVKKWRDFQPLSIREITFETEIDVYNLEVENAHTYFVASAETITNGEYNFIGVHNSKVNFPIEL